MTIDNPKAGHRHQVDSIITRLIKIKEIMVTDHRPNIKNKDVTVEIIVTKIMKGEEVTTQIGEGHIEAEATIDHGTITEAIIDIEMMAIHKLLVQEMWHRTELLTPEQVSQAIRIPSPINW